MKKCYVYYYLNTLKSGIFQYETSIGQIKFDFEPFYIGKGTKERYLDHLKYPYAGKNPHKTNTVNKILRETGKYPIIGFVKTEMTQKDALLLEMELISVIGRKSKKNGSLTNLTDGGDGCLGFTFSKELKEKWSRLAKERAKFGVHNHSSKKVYQYNLDGSFVKEWECKRDCKRELGFNPTGINACCKGRNKTAFNYQWSDIYKGESIKSVVKGKDKNDGYLEFKDKRNKNENVKFNK